MTFIRAFLTLVLGLTVLACRKPETVPALWIGRTPAISRPSDRFTIRILELDGHGNPKDPGQFRQTLASAQKADDAFVFIHGWRRDARDLATMEAFLDIYRKAFECLSNRDLEATVACSAVHTYCHPPTPESKLVVLVLWDGRTGMFHFKTAQQRALSIGGNGLGKILSRLHEAVRPRGTLFAMGHSLGATALAVALAKSFQTGAMPLDGALLVSGAFDVDAFGSARVGITSGNAGTVVLNLFNRGDGYLRLYRWIWGKPAAGAEGLLGIPVSDGGEWDRREDACGTTERNGLDAALRREALYLPLPKGGNAEFLNLDVTRLLHGHTDIENPNAIHLYNHAAAEALFQVLQARQAALDAGALPAFATETSP